MAIQHQVNLAPHNTFGIACKAKLFSSFQSLAELQEILSNPTLAKETILLLGGGSNVLFTKDFDGLILINEIKGITLVEESATELILEAGAGENWHEFVSYGVANNWGGLENLSLIPGKVGAAPMQNIGAYGVEQKDCFVQLEALEIATGQVKTFTKEDCHFDYRESYFKQEGKNRFIILSVQYRLNKLPKIHTEYGAISQELAEMGISTPRVKDVAEAVIRIRRSKLPDPKEIGNAGSFFKNPVIPERLFLEIKARYPEVVSYPAQPGTVKIAAGWLIEKAGWKGFRKDNFGVHAKQALVLVNYGGAKGEEIWDLSGQIVQAIQQKFGVVLEREVNIY